MKRIYVGIDVSKDNFTVSLVDQHNNCLLSGSSYGYDRASMERFVAKVRDFASQETAEAVYGMESTGIYHLPLYQYLLDMEVPVRIFNGLEVRGFKNRIRQVKTDRIDSECIAEALILVGDLDPPRSCPSRIEELRELNRARGRIVKKISECKIQVTRDLDVLCPGYSTVFNDVLCFSSINVMKLAFRKTRFLKASLSDLQSVFHPSMDQSQSLEKASVLHSLFESVVVRKSMLNTCLLELHMLLDEYKLLRCQQQRLEKRIEVLVTSVDTRLCTIPGIGLLTAGTILGELGNINRFASADKVVAFAGLDPSISQSGRSRKTGSISKRGSPILRNALYRASVSAIRVNPVCKDFYDRLKSRGKPTRVCLIAVARKLVHIAFSVEKNQRDFYVPGHIIAGGKLDIN